MVSGYASKLGRVSASLICPASCLGIEISRMNTAIGKCFSSVKFLTSCQIALKTMAEALRFSSRHDFTNPSQFSRHSSERIWNSYNIRILDNVYI